MDNHDCPSAEKYREDFARFRDKQAASAEAPSEPQDQSGSLCSGRMVVLGPSSAEAVEAFVANKFAITTELAIASIEASNREYYEGMRDAYKDVLEEIRRHAESANERQPQNNDRDKPRSLPNNS